MIYQNRNLLYEYSQILAKQKAKFSKAYLSKQDEVNELYAYDVFKMAIEVFLHWSPEQALVRLNAEVVKKMRLDLVMPYMKLPPEVEFNDDYTWILHKLYPERIHYDEAEHVIKIYDKIISGEKYKWPKWYFSEAEGHERACICLRHMIDYNMHYESEEDLYRQFVNGEGTKLMNKLGLKTVIQNEFRDPITFLHEAMFKNTGNDTLYHYYLVQYHFLRAKAVETKCLQGEQI